MKFHVKWKLQHFVVVSKSVYFHEKLQASLSLSTMKKQTKEIPVPFTRHQKHGMRVPS